ncbi:PIN domain-containing protein [Variovorax sp. J22R24]|uniref:PIN domain-containing protein n=1 Tax=Variovorax gracilis TaxID=3053502 RepID=UPI002576AD36|nr:PIN domain-containing protein [Variovorax sp. J22R24]MDM0106522.1 PIN domain-containing protein [Variovorax sp. J22R24]
MTTSTSVHLLVDLENVQPSPGDVEAWLGDAGQAWVFYGPNQLKRKADFELNSPRSTLIPISRTGANSLDFHLVFYLGYLAAKQPQGRFVVLAKDTGYDPPIAHARTLAFSVKRMRALPAVATKTAAPSKPSSSSTVKQSKRAAVAKKEAASGAKPAKRKAPTADSKASPQARPLAKKRPVQKPLIEMYRDLVKDLGAPNRPKSLPALERHIQTKFGLAPVPQKVQQMVDRLLTSDVIHLANDKLGYGPPMAETR